MPGSRSQELYNSLYLFFSRELGKIECSNIDVTNRFPAGVWSTRVETGCGFYLHRPPLHVEPVYSKSPLNAVEFANTGGDGVFYSFLEANGTWTDHSPVVVTYPNAMINDEPSWIVGSCLRDFLCLGRWVGFFYLGDLVLAALQGDRDSINKLSAQEYPEWVDEDHAATLDHLASSFSLKPITDIAKTIAEWQRLYRPLIQHPKGAIG